MASNFLSEDQLLCPICLEMFTRPLTTPCGHNFCTSCLTSYWDNSPVCQCPICKETFERRPNLKVNTFISELASHFVMLQASDSRSSSPASVQLTDIPSPVVPCDVCTAEDPQQAVKSCLECLTSYCSGHLEPHHRAAGLKRHRLVDPVASLDDRVCTEHQHLMASFCRDDRKLLCDVCVASEHRDHHVLTVQQAHEELKDELRSREDDVQQMVQERRQKVKTMKEFVKQSKTDTKDVITDSMVELVTLVSEIQKNQEKLVKVMEEKQKTAEEAAEDMIGSMEQEVTALQRKAMEMKELKQTEDHLTFIQGFLKASVPTVSLDLSMVSFHHHLEIRHMKKSLSGSVAQLKTLVNKMVTEINMFSLSAMTTLKYLQQYEVNVVLDSDTAHPHLLLSDDRKQVRFNVGAGLWQAQSLKPSMFLEHLAVLGHKGFSARKFYFEVFVDQKTEWSLGVATASMDRRGPILRNPQSGLWAIWFMEDRFETFCCPGVTVFSGRVERMGVFVDYDEGEVTFYDVNTATLIYSLTHCVFTEELFPYFNPCDNEFGANFNPMVIVPVGSSFQSATEGFVG